MEIFCSTRRLVLRRFTAGDADLLVELDSDPEVMRFLTHGRPTARAEIEKIILPRFLEYYTLFDGYGHWAALEKETGDFIGWVSMRPRDGDPSDEPELGYRLRRDAWGQGYATEAAQVLVDKAFAESGARRVFAETMAVNAASRRVLEKVGLRYARTFHREFEDPIPGTESGEVEYELLRADWEQQRRNR
ncbi:GNAT family N-acetyltransferase [Nocardioides limicola]|uniref:GNAT family N-acetyltransferase n=1 Tax=Nocardioides limicola TaxID=2803368 RepID=UPI00193BDFA9|nr:GNAT family N-acetyltransferase [Nocardioides sp. DJM-14]